MTASIGQIVIYHVGDSDTARVRSNNADELPAVIVRVWSDGCVNLKVLTDGPVDGWKTMVTYGHGPYCWSRP